MKKIFLKIVKIKEKIHANYVGVMKKIILQQCKNNFCGIVYLEVINEKL